MVLFSQDRKDPNKNASFLSCEKRTIDQDIKNTLNPSMTFDHFITCDSNIFAFSSAFDVANRPVNHYNPLYIFSKLSLGKTHLLNSIGNHIIHKDPSKETGETASVILFYAYL